MIIATVLSALLAAAPPSAPAPAPAPPLDRAVEAAAAQGFAGEVLAGGVAGPAYARAVSAPGRPHRRGALWRWASVSKQVTATLAMQEVAAGRLSLDDTVALRLPAFHGPNAAKVTLRMLLQHTSGLPNPDDTPEGAGAVPGFYLREAGGVGGVKDALGYCAGPAKGAPPTERFAYNNCDTIVLGAVLERATGRSFPQLVAQRIASPLKLRTLGFAQGGRRTPPLTPGRGEDGGPEPRVVLATFGPAGALYGSADDLLAFDRALLDGRLLPQAARETAWAGDPKLGYVALGVWGFSAPLKGCKGAVQLVERRGEIAGVEVRNLLAPQLGRALVVFADRAGFPFGELWQGRGVGYDLASAAFCA